MYEELGGKWEENYVFGLEYVRVDVWENFIKVCGWCECCESILNFFKDVKSKIVNLPLSLKNWIINYEVFFLDLS